MDKKDRVAKLFPKIRPNLLYISFFCSFILMVFLSTKDIQKITFPRYEVIDSITYYLDATVLQGLSMVLVAWVIYRYLIVQEVSRTSSFILTIGILTSMMVTIIILETYILKPCFLYNRIEKSTETAVTAFVAHMLGLAGDEKTSCPSGFTLRQVVLFLSFMLLHEQQVWSKIFEGRIVRALKIPFYILNWAFLILIPFLRFYWQRHILFDIGIAIGIGVFLFWSITILISIPIMRSKEVIQYLTYLVAPIFAFTFIIFIYMENTLLWLMLCWIILMASGFVYRKFSRVTEVDREEI